MAKPKHIMGRRRAAVLLALLSSASNQTLLSALTVGSLNAGLLSSASAATCVTGVTSTFANVVSGVNGTPSTTVVTSVTPTTAAALTGEPRHDIHQRCKRRQWTDGHGSDGSDADSRQRFDEREYYYDIGVVFDRCDSQSGHRNRCNRCDFDHRDGHWHYPRNEQP